MNVAALAAVLAACAHAQSSPTFKGADLYRSRHLTVEAVDKKVGALVASFLIVRGHNKPSRRKEIDNLRRQIEDGIRTLAPLAYVGLHYAETLGPSGREAYLTYDVVDAADAPKRMPFYAAPKGKAADPRGLLAAWQEYLSYGEALTRKGQMPVGERRDCHSAYCPFSGASPQMEALEKRFMQEVRQQAREIRAAAAEEADATKRAAAVSLAGYLGAPAASQVALAALGDPDAGVRAAALRVLSDVALYHKTVAFDAAPIVAALDYPATSDRSGALAACVALSDDPQRRKFLLATAVTSLPRLLKLNQPSNRDLAFTLLSVLSQKSYARDDYAAWEAWAQEASRAAQ